VVCGTKRDVLGVWGAKKVAYLLIFV